LVGAAEPAVPEPPDRLLLPDRFGGVVPTSTNEVTPSLHPPASVGLGGQIPATTKGAPMPEEVRQRIVDSKAGQEAVSWFPATPSVLMPYLGNLDEFGNTAFQPGALLPRDPPGELVQGAKYWLSGLGLRYNLYQSFTWLSLTDVAAGETTLGYYTATYVGKWAVLESVAGGTGGGLSTEANVQLGLTPASRTELPQANLGTVVNPNGTLFGPNGIWLSELAWQQSLAGGRVVLLAGMVDQSNYVDANSYANNSQGQLLNSAFVNSDVLPFPFNNLGLNLQYQPSAHSYVMLGMGANNQTPGQSPFGHLGFANWSYLLELGFTATNVLGLGPGNYRVQPFLATVDGHTQAGLGFNVGQKLGADSPFAWFGRFGFGGTEVTLDGASAQVATGLAVQAPLKRAGLLPRLSNDYLGLGVVWSRPSAAMQPTAHANEYGLEATYVLQLTPLASIQPDLQVIWNPADNPDTTHNLVFQLQVNLTW
jgi:porin